MLALYEVINRERGHGAVRDGGNLAGMGSKCQSSLEFAGNESACRFLAGAARHTTR